MMADTLGELQSILNANPPKGFAELGRYAHELIEFVVFKDPEGAVFRVSRGPADRIASMHSCSLASKGAMQARNLIKVREAVGLKNLGLQVPPDPIRLGVALQPLPPLSAADVQSGALASLQSPFSSRHQIWRLVGIVSNRTVLTVERAVEEQGGEGVDASEVAEDPNPPLVRLTGLPLPTTNETLSSELEQVNMPLKSIESLTKEKKKKMALVRFMYRQHAEEAVRNWLSLFGGEDVRANWVDG
uniref:RRM domain-containing protein n=1 Tax=Chromera velia CCMP2878 TaxID=1169474 RepID=A0A0G4FLU1_9ALVE|eukprot:Cvel_17680.t1-p1 / transcript=Cvel_17680.t1 / gene=Cvel_17680 / organism=Chromera_velia_CCMP2878 / gene_product=hypothetical protein / transcript_product=hypothetical protein / location=Cvel_scaffold1425:46488-47459(+) / protein_length=244 / sequence_SO=supercontig / SO=protein_coding / is_pseudo=false